MKRQRIGNTDDAIAVQGGHAGWAVDAIEVEARALFNADDCQAAIPVLADYSQKSNWLANMIAASLDPYYGASYDERKDYPYSKLSALVPLETMANEYKTKRN